MIIHKECLRDFKKLTSVLVVRFGKNNKFRIKGYYKITNGNFTINRVAYVEGLEHILVSVSQLVNGTENQLLFDEEGSVISNK